jgi:hypothetical protein
LGWTVGQNVRIDYRWGPGNAETMRKYATELVALAPDVVLANTTAALAPYACGKQSRYGGGDRPFRPYTVGADKVINFKVEGSTYPDWTGTEQKRTVLSFTGDELKWTLPASIGGTAEVGWRRVK